MKNERNKWDIGYWLTIGIVTTENLSDRRFYFHLFYRLHWLYFIDRHVQFEKTSPAFHGFSFSSNGLHWSVQFICEFTIFSQSHFSHWHFFFIDLLVSILHDVSQWARSETHIESSCFSFSFNYELFFGFSWIFAFISIDRWIKVEWPTKSQKLCTRKRFSILCLFTLVISLFQNMTYTLKCKTEKCLEAGLACQIFIHVIYISFYMVIPIALILISMCRTCLITLQLKRRFRTSNQENSSLTTELANCRTMKIDENPQSTTLAPPLISSLINSPSMTTSTTTTTTAAAVPFEKTNTHQTPLVSKTRLVNYSSYLRRRRNRSDAQMILLISINVVPFILVHIINEIAYLFELYSVTVAESRQAQLIIILIYLSWYFISATRFYTNCLLSRLYREEFKNRLYMLRHGCKPRLVIVGEVHSRRNSSRFHVPLMINGAETTYIPSSSARSGTAVWTNRFIISRCCFTFEKEQKKNDRFRTFH